jgi:hypothetical protein
LRFFNSNLRTIGAAALLIPPRAGHSSGVGVGSGSEQSDDLSRVPILIRLSR